MAIAKIEREMIARGEGCLGRAADDEPVFILRAKDRFAPEFISLWANEVELAAKQPGTLTKERERKIQEARDLASEMTRWQHANGSKIPD